MANNISLECLESNLSLKSGEIMIFFFLSLLFSGHSLFFSLTQGLKYKKNKLLDKNEVIQIKRTTKRKRKKCTRMENNLLIIWA
jgi:hypothetical protein